MNVFITLDYELFLGKETGSVNNCLVLPTIALMEVLAETDTKATFMVDGAYLYRMEELKDKYDAIQNDYEMVKNNLVDINRRGHSIQYHFHPQWLYSQFDPGKGWVLDYEHYKLSDVPKEKLKIAFNEGLNILSEITGCRPCAFRAGGFTLCSFDTYGPLFEHNGIQLDSSVIVGASMNSKFQVYNYKSAPQKSLYFFYDDICKEVDETDINKFIEMPISHSNRMPSFIYLIKKRKMTSKLFPWKQYGDGIGVASKLTIAQRYKEQFKKFLGTMRFGASIDYFQSLALWKVYEDCKRNNDRNMVILGHPKLITDKALVNVKSFIDEMIKDGNEFHTLDEIVANKNLSDGA